MSVSCICWNYFLRQEHVTVLSVTVSGADHRTGDEPRQPGALTIIPMPLVAALLEADYPSLQEKSPLLHGLPSTETVFGSKSNAGYCSTANNASEVPCQEVLFFYLFLEKLVQKCILIPVLV